MARSRLRRRNSIIRIKAGEGVQTHIHGSPAIMGRFKGSELVDFGAETLLWLFEQDTGNRPDAI